MMIVLVVGVCVGFFCRAHLPGLPHTHPPNLGEGPKSLPRTRPFSRGQQRMSRWTSEASPFHAKDMASFAEHYPSGL